MTKEIIVGVVTAITVSILYFIWDSITKVSFFVPKQAVIAFELEECPKPGWEEYQKAYGRFIRGFDKAKAKTDPKSTPVIGELQGDMIRSHEHHVLGMSRGGPVTTGGAFRTDIDGGTSDRKFITAGVVNADSGDETRPKNVSLLYCIKK